MKRYWGLRHGALQAAIWAEACAAVMIFGYNQAAAGGVLTSESFNKQFPKMDVIDTTGSQKQYNSTIQGMSEKKRNAARVSADHSQVLSLLSIP